MKMQQQLRVSLYEVRLIPEVGQTFMLSGFRFEILRRHRHQIILLRITPPQKEDGSRDQPL